MENQKRYDLNIKGLGTSGGGVFDRVTIEGIGKINGDVDCCDIVIEGVGNVEGNLKTVKGKMNGKCGIDGNVRSHEFEISGHTKITGDMHVTKADLEGIVTILGGVTADTLENKGVIKVSGDCNTEVFISKGGFTIGGLLNAGNIQIELYAPCKAKEIGGEKIEVRMGHSISIRKLIKALFPVFGINNGLSIETIEGDEIYLEDTKAKVVRGNNVKIGKGCEIDLVEYKALYEKSDSSIVAHDKKIS